MNLKKLSACFASILIGALAVSVVIAPGVAVGAVRSITPPDGNAVASGEETLSRLLAGGTIGVGTGTMRLSYWTARTSRTSTQVKVVTSSTAAAATPTLCRIGLYTVSSAGLLTLVASTANDTTLFAATNTAYTKAWSASYDIVAGQRYAIGILVVSGAATPTFAAALTISAESGTAPRTGGSIAAADLPSSQADAGLSGFGGVIYAVI